MRNPIVLLLLLVGFFVAGLFIGQFVAFALLYPFLGNDVMELGGMLQHIADYPELKLAVLALQGVISIVSMILAPYLFNNWYYKKAIYVGYAYPSDVFFLATILIMICSIPAISWLADLNMQVHLPQSLQWLEIAARNKEVELKKLTEYFTNFSGTSDFLLSLLVIAIIPAIGEELIFRGMFQNLFFECFRNKHVAVWVAAVLFSAIHFQFFGFIPRMLLGALMGYLYVWTGNLAIPILAHFTNNGFTLLLLYMKSLGRLKMDVETSKEMPASLIVGSFLVVAVLLYVFYKQLHNPKQKEGL